MVGQVALGIDPETVQRIGEDLIPPRSLRLPRPWVSR